MKKIFSILFLFCSLFLHAQKAQQNTTNLGQQHGIVGSVFATNFSSLPSGWTLTHPNSTVSYGSSGAVISSTAHGGWTDYFESDYYNLDKQQVQLVVIPGSKDSASHGIGISFGSNALFYSISSFMQYSLTNAYDSGMMKFGSSSTTYSDSSGSMSFNTSDTTIWTITREQWKITLTAYDKTTGASISKSLQNANLFGTGGKLRIYFLGGSQHIASFTVYSTDPFGIVAIFGDSQAAGGAASSESENWCNRLFAGNKLRFNNLSYPSITTQYALTSTLPNLYLTKPKVVIICTGYNERRDLVTDTSTFKGYYDSAIVRIQRNCPGVTIFLTTLIPTYNGTGSATDPFSVCIKNIGAYYGLQVIDIRAALLGSGGTGINPAYLGNDAVHLSDSGNYIYARTVKNAVASYLQEFQTSDTSSYAHLDVQNLPPASDGDMPVFVDAFGNFKVRSNKDPNINKYILNGYNNSGADAIYGSTSAYTTAPAHQIIKGSLALLDSGLNIHNSTFGLYINYNGGNDNMLVTNRSHAGYTSPLEGEFFNNAHQNIIFESFTSATTGNYPQYIGSSKNIFIGSPSASSTSYLTGGNNIGIGTWTASVAMTTATGNFGAGQDAFKGFTTNQYNLNIITRNTGANSSNVVNDVIRLGDLSASYSAPAYSVVLAPYQYATTTSLYVGGYAAASPTYGKAWYRSANATGTNVIGSDMYLLPGSGTGTARGGSLYFGYSAVGGSSSNINSTYSYPMRVDSIGNIVYGGGADNGITGFQIGGNISLTSAGNYLQIAEGTNGIVGQTTLVSGTKAITITGLTTSSRAFITLVTPSGTSLTTTYQAVCTSNTLTIQANVAAGTINTADGSTLNYIIINR
ncbi:MAG: SGNH/GDSL hydrolase family protein [Bacteroidetes bacterium]|nr:SGNH/GDSL hydrolase family protein [Bacteroidota bacterium]